MSDSAPGTDLLTAVEASLDRRDIEHRAERAAQTARIEATQSSVAELTDEVRSGFNRVEVRMARGDEKIGLHDKVIIGGIAMLLLGLVGTAGTALLWVLRNMGAPALALVVLTGCGQRDVTDRRLTATAWHMGHALENGADPMAIAAGLKQATEKVAEEDGFVIDKAATQGEP